MSELRVDESLVGTNVTNAARPEWGTGRVLRVQRTGASGSAPCRVSIQFPVGHKTLLVPPARLQAPCAEDTRVHGWLDGLAGNTLDQRLRSLPESADDRLAFPPQRVALLARLYRYDEQSASLLRWARDQTGVADPLGHWTRDELLVAFGRFCEERDSTLRAVLAQVRQKEGQEAVDALLSGIEEPQRGRILTALRRVI